MDRMDQSSYWSLLGVLRWILEMASPIFFMRLMPLALISSRCFSILYYFLQRSSSFMFLLYFSR